MKKLNVLIFSVLWGGVSAQVGIGTTTPSNDLDVESGDATKTAIEINNTSTGDPKINFQFGVSAPTFSIGIDNSDADKFKIGTSALETNTRFTIDASGNVGIGTTSPSTKLHLDGTFRLVDGNQSNGKVLTSDANGVATWETASGGSLPAGTSGQTLRHDGTTWVANSTIFNNGTNVGIGTAAPNAPLQFANSIANRKIVLWDELNNNHQFHGFGINLNTLRYQIPGTVDSHVFYAGTSSTTSNELMRITGTGFVGIGTASPTTNLHVVGTTILEGSTVVNETGAATNFRVESDANANMLFVNGTTNGVGIGTATPNAPLQFAQTAANRKIVLYESANNDHQYYGLGINSDILRYQVAVATDNHVFYAGTSSTTSNELMRIQGNGRVGIGMTASTNLLEVNGTASKTAAGDWLANSDARLKKDIKQMDSKTVLDKMLALKGITYYWNDTVTGSKRPTQLQYGFTAQNIQEVFPILVEEDNLGYLQTAYGTYDAMYVESMRALQQQIDAQQAIIEAQEREIDALKQNALKVAELENKMNAMLLLLNNKQELTVKQ